MVDSIILMVEFTYFNCNRVVFHVHIGVHWNLQAFQHYRATSDAREQIKNPKRSAVCVAAFVEVLAIC